jgi:hypothetical protein
MTRAAVQAMIPVIVSQLKPLIAAALTSNIDRAMAFQLENFKDALQKDCELKTQEVRNSASTSVARLTGRIQVMEQEITLLRQQIGVTEVALDIQGQATRANNIVVQNLAEGLEGANLKRHLTGILPGVSEGAILEVKRLGARRPGAHRPRPILARFTDSDTKHAAFKSGRDLRRDNVFVDDDLTPG